MRELIQAALKVMARTGLFLSVVAWVVSQWWAIGVSPRYAVICLVSEGWVCSVLPARPNLGKVQADCQLVGKGGGIESINGAAFAPLVEAPSVPEMYQNIGWKFRFPGVVASTYPGTFSHLAIRHYLIVSTFTIFNVALWWFYRKPREVTPCES